MTTKHTLAPWVVTGTGGINGYVIRDAKYSHVIIAVININYIHNRQAAKLIAAAPDLLEALNEFIRAGIGHSTNLENQKIAFEKARAAIAQATT